MVLGYNGELKMLTFLTESTKDFQETSTIGGFNNGASKNSFDEIFTEAYNNLMGKGVDLMLDVNNLVRNKAMLASFKEQMLGELKTECAEMQQADASDFGTHAYLYEQVSDMFDNCCEDFVKESTRIGNLLPIKAIDFPILIKQALKLATNDIMQTEVTRTPIVKKHLEQTYIVDSNDKSKRWRYPQCFFTDEFKEVYKAGKGLPIKNDPVAIADLKNFDIITNLVDGADVKRDNITYNLQITKAIFTDDAGVDVEIPLNPAMRINMSDNTWLGGKIQKTVKDSTGADVEINDLIMGMIDFQTNTTSLASTTGQITKVVFDGYLSNELNERSVTFDYAREEREWKIEDGTRVDVPYSLEELEDAKALMDIDLYKKTYNNLSDYLIQMEDSDVLAWLDEQFDLYDGVEVDMLGFEGFVTKRVFDCDSTSITTALPSEYIEKMLKFAIDGLIVDLADNAKLEDMTFVIYGNPRYIRLLNAYVNWVTRPGSTSNGVKLDYSYGIMTSGDVKVQVVSTKKVNAKYDADAKLHQGIRIIPFPLSKEQFTFKHYKYTTHILTAQNSAYRAANRPGGSMTNLMGVSRYVNAAVQGIQARMDIANLEPWVKLG